LCYNLAIRWLEDEVMSPRKPNILLVVLDTLRRDHLSSYGYTRETSPEFDAFAARAAQFTRAVAPGQWTIPVHASLFTGLYPTTHRVTQSNSQLSDMYPTLAEILQSEGYHTTAFCNNPLVGVLENGLQRGFDEFYNYASAIPQRPVEAQHPLRRELTKWLRPYARRAGNVFARSDTLFRLSLHPLLTPYWSKLINFKGNTANSITDVIDYWKRHRAGGAEKPIFTFVNLMGAHLPYHPPLDALDRIAPKRRHDRHSIAYMRRFNADAAGWASPPETPFEDWQTETLTDFYDAEIVHQDEQLGRLLAYLRESGALEDTVVVVMADHGEGHGEHNLFGHGFNVHQELVHVPMVIHDPDGRFPHGRQVEANVSTRRLFHTLLDIAGAKPPLDEADPNADIERLSLVNLDGERNMAFSEAFPPMTFVHVLEHRSPAVIEQLSLRQVRRTIYNDSYKLITIDKDVESVYNIAHDPFETRNLSTDVELREHMADMQRKVNLFVQQAESGRADVDQVSQVSPEVMERLRALGYIE
jgi:arylsulfatase A-like enzyme